MSEREQFNPSETYPLPGENLPFWLTVSFALMGVLVATGAAWLWLLERAVLQAPSRTPGAHVSVPAVLPPDEIAGVKPMLPAAGITGTQTATENGETGVVPEQSSSAAVTSSVSASLTPPNDSALSWSEATATPQANVHLVQCPPEVTVFFKRGSTVLAKHDRTAAFLTLQQFLTQHPHARVSIEGHADSIGTADYNLLLSYWRAKAVVALLKNAGVRDAQIRIRASGVDAPIAGVPSSSGENRRVLITVEGIENCATSTAESVRQ